MTRGEAFKTGFHAALGVAALLLLLGIGFYVLSAVASIATPFVVSIVVALMLDPLVDYAQRRWTRSRRMPAVLSVYLLFLLVFTAILSYVVPHLIEQAQRLVEVAPTAASRAQEETNRWLASHRRLGPIALPESVDALVTQYAEQLSAAFKASASGVAAVILGSVSRLLSVVLIPIITFYLLVDMDRLRARFFYLLPDRIRASALQTTIDVGGVFGNYVRGLATICTAYAVVAVVILFAFGLKSYALLLGVAAGVLYAVPYVGALATVLLVALVASVVASKTIGIVLAIIVVLLGMNQVFDNLVMPRVVGGGVGLHPLLAMFALLLGGNLLGLWGMLLAVPIAASIQVVLFRLFPHLAAPTPILFYRSVDAAARRAARKEAEPPPPAEPVASEAAVAPSDAAPVPEIPVVETVAAPAADDLSPPAPRVPRSPREDR